MFTSLTLKVRKWRHEVVYPKSASQEVAGLAFKPICLTLESGLLITISRH